MGFETFLESKRRLNSTCTIGTESSGKSGKAPFGCYYFIKEKCKACVTANKEKMQDQSHN